MAYREPLIWCDVGNTRLHLLDHGVVRHFGHEEGLARYAGHRVVYICVNEKIGRRIATEAPDWVPLPFPDFSTRYKGIGIDRIAAALALEDGVVIDAGSAITVDIMENGQHLGGWIWPGLRAWQNAYAAISPTLDLPLDETVARRRLPQSTREALSFGVYASLAVTVERYASDRRIVLTGGDADRLAPLFPHATVDETLVFRGMQKIWKESMC